jgi:hypothetical protein
MSFINWGHETPEQKEIRRRMEERMMFEQMSYSAAMAAAASAGSGKLPLTKQGQTSSYVYESETGQYYIGVMDFEKGSFSAIFNTDLNTGDDWYYDDNNYDGTYIVQDRGYLMTFSNNNTSDKVFFFFSAGGAIIQKLELITVDTEVFSSNGNFIVVCDWDAYTIWWFDGLEVRTETLPENTVEWDYENANLSGFFITSYTAEGATSFYNVFFNSGSGLNQILQKDVTNPNNSYTLSIYENSNIFRLWNYNFNFASSEYTHIYYYDNTGVELADLDVSTGNYNNKFADVFGAGKHVDTFFNDTEYLICYYDEVVGDLLTTTHDRVNYPNFIVTGQYRNNGNQFDNLTENGLITFSNTDLGSTKDLYNVTYCDFIRLYDGMEDLDTIIPFADNEPKGIDWDNIRIADSIFVPNCPTYEVLSPQLAYLTFTSSGLITNTPLISFDDYDYFNTNLLGNRCLIDAWVDSGNSPGTYFITNKTGTGFLEYSYDIGDSNYYEHEGDVVVWRNDSDTDFQSYYLPANDPAPFEAIILPPFGRIQTTSTYRQENKLYPGNLLIQSGEGRRLYLFNDVGEDYINDGGNDMYDGGNRLNTDLDVEIAYTHTQMVETIEGDEDIEATSSMFTMDGEVVDGTAKFGAGSQYFTNLYPGLFTMVAKGVDITEFFISGGTGIDGGGYNTVDSYQVTIGANQYTAFLKTTTGGGSDFDGESDPTINQIIIVNAQDVALIQEIDPDVDTNNDYHKILGLDTAGVTDVHYLLMSTYNRSVQHGFSGSDFTNVVDTYLNIIDDLSISATLTALNEDYSLITDEIQDTESYTLTLVKSDGSVIEKDSAFCNEGLDLGPTMCAGAYINTDGFACVDVYDINLELISTYVSTETSVNTIRIIDNRLYIVTNYFDENEDEHTVMAIMKGNSFIKKEYVNNTDWRTSNDYAAWYTI